ncbi:retrotransposon-related protein [Tanacetum coccineum]
MKSLCFKSNNSLLLILNSQGASTRYKWCKLSILPIRVVSIGAFIDLMDEQTVRRWLKEQQDRAETFAQQQTAAFQLQLDTLRAELQATRGLMIGRPGSGGDPGLLLPRSMRLDVPKFTGEDPDKWIFSIKEYFSLLNTTADQRLWIDRFVESVKDRFGPSKYEDPQGALSKLLQLGTVEEYQREFEKLMNRVTNIPESLLISFYISGLKLHIQRGLLVSKPNTLGDAFSLARITEASLDDQATSVAVTATKLVTSTGGQRQPNTRFGVPSLASTKPALLPTPSETTVTTNLKPLAIKWISPAERQDRLSKGLCFNCDNKWICGHKCPGKFLLLMSDEGEDAEAETDTTIVDAIESYDISILNSLIG